MVNYPIKTGSYIGVISYRRSNSAVLGLDNLNYGGWAEPDPEVREEERAAPNHYSADPISPMQIAMQSFSEDQLSSSTGSPRHFPSLRDSSDEEIEFSVFSTPSPRH
ncbi:unnamed protein product [Allacma fusca]|uniref:Uncharacterized protein n=1 Tax=Allacma fusca TaxID=39272 RepID=A0A8J2K9A9_9HEXA|nr:unnamed protein product [Allacma fusca]